jgi:hypothetical protein
MAVKDYLLKPFSRGSSTSNLPAKGCHTITISEAPPRGSLSQDSIEIKIKVDEKDGWCPLALLLFQAARGDGDLCQLEVSQLV